MKKLILLLCLVCLLITSTLRAAGLSGIILAGGGGTISSVPAAPTGVSATAGNTQNTVTWSASSGSTSCNLYWKSGSSMSGNCTGNGTKVSGVTSPDVITSLTNGTTYYYMMTCQNAAGESACSSEVSGTPNVTITVPGAPTSVMATAGNTQNTITWSAPSTGGTPTSYNLYWSTSDMESTCSSGSKVTGVSSPNIITSLTNGTKYYYMLTAQNSAGEGACSSEVNATPVVAPTNFLNDPYIYLALNFENNTNDSNHEHINNLTGGSPSYSYSTDVHWSSYSALFNNTMSSIISANQTTGFPFLASGTTAFSVGGWFNTTNIGNLQYFLGMSDSGGASFFIGILGGNIVGGVKGPSLFVETSGFAPTANTDYFIVLTWDGAYLHLYKGLASTSVAEVTPAVACTGTPYTGKPFNIGGLYSGAGSMAGSYYDEVFLFARALSITEAESIRAHRIDGSN